MTTAHVIVRGRVQGVFYRQSTREKATSLGLSGWVRNVHDGTVELKACGAKDQVQSLVDWCHQGPPSAAVTAVEVQWKDSDCSEEFGNRFEIR